MPIIMRRHAEHGGQINPHLTNVFRHGVLLMSLFVEGSSPLMPRLSSPEAIKRRKKPTFYFESPAK
jgi:hypothetical protein